MRNIITTTFVTLDGVMQAPGGPEEDTEGGFAYGGWQAGIAFDDILGNAITEMMTPPFAMLLGRTTYMIFAGYWPKQDPNHPVAKPFNGAHKYIVSDEPFNPEWENSTVITGDVPAELRKLKETDGPDLIVWGSGNLIQTLLKEKLVDRMRIFIHPVTIGSGKRLFENGTIPGKWKLTDSRVTGAGVIIATYMPDGPLKTGTISA